MRTERRTAGGREATPEAASPVSGATSADAAWVAAALGVAAAVYAAYLLTHPLPSYGAGLYAQIATEVAASGYRLPETIPGYTHGGVPFAYPPLMYYVLAALHDLTGADMLTISRVLPGLVVVASVVPYYAIARRLLGTPARAGLATVAFAAAGPLLQWHLSAGGVVRAPAFLLALAGIYVGLGLFDGGDLRLVPPAAALFGLTVLTHPTYATYFGVSYLVLFVFRDRTPAGLARGAVVAGGGLALAAPWWTRVVATHGVGVFGAAAGTHRGLGGGLERVLDQFVYTLDPNLVAPFYLAAYAGGVYLAWRRRYLLPAWLVAAAYVVGKERFQFVPGGVLAAVFVAEVVLPRVRAAAPPARRRVAVRLAVVAVVALAGAVGALHAGGVLNAHEGDRTQPAFVDGADVAAMEWARAHTDPGAAFVVLGDAAEWFPFVAERTILVGHWGVEWTTPEQYRTQVSLFETVSTCDSARCLTRTLSGAPVGDSPEYVYVPRGEFTVRGLADGRSDRLVPAMIDSPRYRLAFANHGVAVFRVAPSFRIPVGPEPGDRDAFRLSAGHRKAVHRERRATRATAGASASRVPGRPTRVRPGRAPRARTVPAARPTRA